MAIDTPNCRFIVAHLQQMLEICLVVITHYFFKEGQRPRGMDLKHKFHLWHKLRKFDDVDVTLNGLMSNEKQIKNKVSLVKL
jgi:hypothetical protein